MLMREVCEESFEADSPAEGIIELGGYATFGALSESGGVELVLDPTELESLLLYFAPTGAREYIEITAALAVAGFKSQDIGRNNNSGRNVSVWYRMPASGGPTLPVTIPGTALGSCCMFNSTSIYTPSGWVYIAPSLEIRASKRYGARFKFIPAERAKNE